MQTDSFTLHFSSLKDFRQSAKEQAKLNSHFPLNPLTPTNQTLAVTSFALNSERGRHERANEVVAVLGLPRASPRSRKLDCLESWTATERALNSERRGRERSSGSAWFSPSIATL